MGLGYLYGVLKLKINNRKFFLWQLGKGLELLNKGSCCSFIANEPKEWLPVSDINFSSLATPLGIPTAAWSWICGPLFSK